MKIQESSIQYFSKSLFWQKRKVFVIVLVTAYEAYSFCSNEGSLVEYHVYFNLFSQFSGSLCSKGFDFDTKTTISFIVANIYHCDVICSVPFCSVQFHLVWNRYCYCSPSNITRSGLMSKDHLSWALIEFMK